MLPRLLPRGWWLAASRKTASGESVCSRAAKTRENTGSGSARIAATTSWRGVSSRRADVGFGSLVPVACLSLTAIAL